MLKIYSCILFVVCLPFGSFSQKEKKSNVLELSELSIEELMQIKVSTPSKIEETVREAPSSITVFTKEQIQNMGINNVYDLLNYVPGFQATRDIALSEVEVIEARGIGGLKPFILIQIDGERVNDLFIERGTQFLPYLSTANVKQVEVIGGPASALYGSNAVLGIVNVITEKEQNQVIVKGGSQNSISAEGSFYAVGKKGVNYSASAFHYRDDGYQYSINGQTTNDAKSGNGMNVGIHYKGIKFNTFYYENSFSDFIKYTNQICNEINKNRTSNWYVVLSWEKNLTRKIDIKLKTRYVSRTWDPFGLVVPGIPAAGFSQPFYFGPSIKTGDFVNSIDINYKLNRSNQFLVGASYRYAGVPTITLHSNYYSSEDQNAIPADTFYLGVVKDFKDPKSGYYKFMSIYGVYGQYKLTLFKQLKINLGLRYSYYEIGGTALNPRVGIIYNTPFNSTIKAMYGTAFRSPTFNELFSNDPVTVGNPNLKPENSSTKEIGYYQKIKKTQTIVTYFRNSIANIIREVPQPSAPATFINSDSIIKSSGIEMSFYANITSKLLAGITYTVIFDAGNTVYPNFGSFNFDYRLRKWNFNLNGIVRDKIDALPNQDPYFLLNGKIRYKVSENVELNIASQNMLGQSYYTYSERLSNVNAAIPNRGTEWCIGLKINY